jgi:hypothetical protein
MTDPNRALSTTTNGKMLMPSGKVRTAVDLMIWSGTHRDDAAKVAGLTPKSLYNAFRKHHVRQYYLAQLEVLRTSAKARTFHRLEELAHQDDNRGAAVKACQVILTDEVRPLAGASGPASPGFTIVIAPRFQSSLDEATVIDAPPAPAEPAIDDRPR